MLQAVLSHQIDKAETLTGESADYLRDLLRASPAALFKFMLIQPLAQHRRKASAEAVHAARLVATMHEDCGPCVQIVINFARAENIEPAVLKQVVARDWDALPDPLPLVCRYADAVCAARPEAAALAEEVSRALGETARADLALAITTSRMFPTLKRALGHGVSCALVNFEGIG